MITFITLIMGNANPTNFVVFEQTSQKFGLKPPAQHRNLKNCVSRRSLDISTLASRDQKLINTLKKNPFFKETFHQEEEEDSESLHYKLQMQCAVYSLQFASDFTEAYVHAHVTQQLSNSANLLQNQKIRIARGHLHHRSVRLQMLQTQLQKRTPSSINLQNYFSYEMAQVEFTAQVEFLKTGPRQQKVLSNEKLCQMKNYCFISGFKKISLENSEKKVASRIVRVNSKNPPVATCSKTELRLTNLESTPRFEDRSENSQCKKSRRPIPNTQTTLEHKADTISQKLAFLKEKNSIAKNKAARSVFIDLMQNGKISVKKGLEISTKNMKELSSILKESGSNISSMPTKKNKSPVQTPSIEGLIFSFQPQETEPSKHFDGSDRYKESENLEDAILRVSSKNRQKRENFFKENSNTSIDLQIKNQTFKKQLENYIDFNLVTKQKPRILNFEKSAITSKRNSAYNLIGVNATATEINRRALFSPEVSQIDDNRLSFQIQERLSNNNKIDISPLKQKSSSQKYFGLGLSPTQLSKLSNSGKKLSKMALLKQISSNASPIKKRAQTLDQSCLPVQADSNTINLSNYSFFKAKLGYQDREFKADSHILKTRILERNRSSKGFDYNANHLCSNSLKKLFRSDKLTMDSDKINDYYLLSTNQSSKDTLQQAYPVSLRIKAFPANVKFNVVNCFKK